MTLEYWRKRFMYSPDELMQEFKQLSILEKIALETGEEDDIKLGEYLGTSDYRYVDGNIRELTQKYYFKGKEGITYSKHPFYIRSGMHRHDFFEMAYAYKGDFVQTINNTQMTIREGSLLLLDTYVSHSVGPVDENTIIVNILMTREYFSEKLMKRFSQNNLITEFIVSALYKNSLKGNYLHFSLDNNDEIRNYINAVLLELKHDNPGRDEIINSFMIILLTMLAREKNCVNDQPSGSRTTPSSVVSILDYMNKNYMNLTLEDAAGYFHFSPNYLSRLLKKYTGKTFISIILELKLEKTIFLLEHTDFSISRIAEIAGFRNMNYFYKLFEKKYGCTPKGYRGKLEESTR